MTQISRENFIQVFGDIDTAFDDAAKFVKKGKGIYYYDLWHNHSGIALEAGIKGIPLDAGHLKASSTQHILFLSGGSIDFDIRPDNPERAGTIVDFRSFAEGTGIEIR